jgi:hypothetical protein
MLIALVLYGSARADAPLAKGSSVAVVEIASAGLSSQQRYGTVKPELKLGSVGDVFAIGCLKAIVAQGFRPVEITAIVELFRGATSLDRLQQLAHVDAFIEGAGLGRSGRMSPKGMRAVSLSLRDAKTGQELRAIKIDEDWSDPLSLGERGCGQLLSSR